jgi:hypothetical protein
MRLTLLLPLIFSLNTARAGELSLAEPEARWDKRSIRVCWQESEDPNSRFSEAERKAVEESVTSEFTPDRTGIEFISWQSCEESGAKRPDVVLIQSRVNRGGFFRIWGMATIGCKLGPKDKSPFVYLFYDEALAPRYKMEPLQHLKMTALHEFGHLAGLRHEHIREEAKAAEDASCLTGESPGPEVKSFGSYDPNSIMNYCWNGFLRRHGTRGHIQVTEGKTLEEILRSNRLYHDPELFQLSPESTPGGFRIDIRIALSQGDRFTLRSLYP